MTQTGSIACLSALLCLGAGLASSPARAQRVGTYNGVQANGQPISLTVSRYQGQLIVESINVQVQTTCRGGQSLEIDTGYGEVGPIVNGSGQDAFNFGATYFSESFTFDDATHSVSGFASVEFSMFEPPPPGSLVPARSTFCTIGRQAYAAVLGQDAAFDPHAKVVRFRRPAQ